MLDQIFTLFLNISRFIKENEKYVLSKEVLGPVGRLKAINSAIYHDSSYKPPYVTIFDKGIFTLRNHRNAPVSIPLDGIRCALISSQSQLLEALHAVLPTTLDVAALPFHHLFDDFSAVALHLQLRNKALLESYLSACWSSVLNGDFPSGDKLWTKWGLCRAEVNKWLQASDHCFSLACASIILATGGANLGMLKHQQFSGRGRTIFLLRDGTMAFINPFSSVGTQNCNLDLVSVTQELTQYLLILLVILLPISRALRKLRGQSHPFASSHFWLLYGPRPKDILYTEADLNTALRTITESTFGFALEAKILFRMVRQVFWAEFPQLYHNNMDGFRSPVDDLAQHRYSTGIANYGRLTVFPRAPHLIGDRPWRHLAICQIWQALVGIAPIKDMWRLLLENTHLSSQLENSSHYLAFQTARIQVKTIYGIFNAAGSRKREMATQVLRDTPFLKGITVSWLSLVPQFSFDVS
jgi:hypothetical protein